MMRAKSYCVATICISLFGISRAPAAEIRTYSFSGDPPAYRWQTDGPGGPIRAEVTGTFTVSLDFDHHTGTVLSLDAHLSNAEAYSFSSNTWNSIFWLQDFFSAGTFYDQYRPPVNGDLVPADYRPLGPGSLTQTMTDQFIGIKLSEIPQSIRFWMGEGVGFEPAPANAWLLISNGTKPQPDPHSTGLAGSYILYLKGNEAFLSYSMGGADLEIEIAAARATLIPEPSIVGLGVIAIVSVFSGRNRRAK